MLRSKGAGRVGDLDWIVERGGCGNVAPFSLCLQSMGIRWCAVATGLYEDSCAPLTTPDLVMPPAGGGLAR